MTLLLSETPVWLTPAGWIVTFLLGLLSALLYRFFTKEKQSISWSILGEYEILPSKALDIGSVPLSILADGIEVKSLSSVRLRIGNTGTKQVDSIHIYFTFNKESTVLESKLVSDLREYGEFVNVDVDPNNDHKVIVAIEYMKKAEEIEFDVILDSYNLGTVEASETIQHAEFNYVQPSRWDISKNSSLLKSLAMGIAGVRYDPTVGPLNKMAEALRLINLRISEAPEYLDPLGSVADSLNKIEKQLETVQSTLAKADFPDEPSEESSAGKSSEN